MKGIFYGWWIVFACFLIAFYRNGTIGVGFTAFFEPIAEETGWSYTQISIAASLRGMEMAIFAPIMGFLVDRFGPRKLIFGGMLTMGLGFILLSQANSLTMFYGAFVVLQLCQDWHVRHSLIPEWAGPREIVGPLWDGRRTP